MNRWVIALAVGLFARPSSAGPLDLQQGDHICIVGNTLADRMQHDGWLETFLHAARPRHELVVRNLGFSGDEVTTQLRSAGFGSPDDWLTRCRADVVFVFFGYNESFGGTAGLPKFQSDLDSYVNHLRSKKFNGRSPPRVVLFTPTACEDTGNTLLPDAQAANERLAPYATAIQQVARDRECPVVDLFTTTRAEFPRWKTQGGCTINGVHLTETGQRVVGVQACTQLGLEMRPVKELPQLLDLRNAVNDKNFHWFQRYRTTDGYSIYGGRADLKFVNGQTNREVAQREMEVLDVMTANRDRRVWALSQGKEYRVDDSNTPPFIPVVTNKPGQGPNGTHLFLGGHEAIQKMTLGQGLRVNLFASEEKWPELANPVQMTWDARGRLWVAVWPSYPHWKPKEKLDDKILVFEDTDGDGVADKMEVFADGLSNPTGFELVNGGVLVCQAPDLMFLKDTDGDGKADHRERVLHGLDSADTHHTSNSFALDPGGAVYFQEGTFHHTQVETPWGPPVRNANAGVYRYEPRSHKFEAYITYGFANPHGHAFDRWGQDIVVDGTGSQPYHAALFSGHLDYPNKHKHPPQVYQQRTRPCPGIEYLSSRHFPDEFQGNLLVANVIGVQGILRYRVDDDGASFKGTELEPVLTSTDPNFRPSDIKVGPDGAVYFIDWHNPIIGHMQHNLRDPSRDRNHGRIYRITHEGRELSKSPTIAGQPVAKLLDLLKEPENRVRMRVRGELAMRPAAEVKPAFEKWLAALSKSDSEYEHHRLEALWVCQQLHMIHEPLLRQVLASPDFRARAAAVRVLCYWREGVPEALTLLRALAADKHPRVRLEAVRAASFLRRPEAIEIALIAAEQPADEYLNFTRGETLRALEPLFKLAVERGEKVHFATDVGARYLLRNLPVERLLTMERTPAICRELLLRPGVGDDHRRVALQHLAGLEKATEINTLLATIRVFDGKEVGANEGVAFDLVRLLNGRPGNELAAARAELEELAKHGRRPVLRQVAYLGLINVDGKADRAWMLASRSAGGLIDFLHAIPLIPDPGVRTTVYPKIAPLLDGLPASLSAGKDNAVRGRFVRIELPGARRTLSLAEVQVMSDGRNIARQGKASQKNTASGGNAGRAIDGNSSGRYGDGGISHSAENTDNPWWELDLGGEHQIDSISVYNRTDGELGNRLNNFTLRVLDGARTTVFVKDRIPAPKDSTEIMLRDSAADQVRRSAMNALVSVRGQEAATFAALARFVMNGKDRHAAVRALQKLPRSGWPKDQAGPVVDSLLAYLKTVPVAERTQSAALDAMELADALTTLLPFDRAIDVRRQLRAIGVHVVKVGTLPERMAYDKELIVVQAGKPVEFVLENADLMPHNFVILQPGALEEIGTLAEATATDADAPKRNYVPNSKKVLHASKLLQPGQSQRLSFTAPSEPGVFPYVCTYPGHWRTMHGALYVVGDLDSYLANPEAYLAARPMTIADTLLKDRRPRTEWKVSDLADAVKDMKHGRSFASGKQMFQIASCSSCHQLEGVGNNYGPNLKELDPKWTVHDVLKEIIEPSARINEKFQSYLITLDSGQTLTGLIIEDNVDRVRVIENPLSKAEPVVLRPSQIEARQKSPTSLMPKGLLDKLTKDEVLDLIAYVMAKGDSGHPLFQGGGHGHKNMNHGVRR